MIFGNLKLENILQVNDKTRLDARGSYISKGEADISMVEIEPEAGFGFIEVTGIVEDNQSDDWHLDWQYSVDGTKTVSVRITTDGAPQTFTKDIEVISEADDKLFSDDDELKQHEPDILNWTEEGRNSFKNVHRLSQDRILTYLDEQRIHDYNGDKLTKASIIDIQEVNDWSKFQTLVYIFEGISNSSEDIFHEKAIRYREQLMKARNRGILRLDRSGDGTVDTDKDMRSVRVVRR